MWITFFDWLDFNNHSCFVPYKSYNFVGNIKSYPHQLHFKFRNYLFKYFYQYEKYMNIPMLIYTLFWPWGSFKCKSTSARISFSAKFRILKNKIQYSSLILKFIFNPKQKNVRTFETEIFNTFSLLIFLFISVNITLINRWCNSIGNNKIIWIIYITSFYLRYLHKIRMVTYPTSFIIY